MSLSALLKEFYPKAIQDQFNNATVLMKRMKRKTADIQGNRAVVPLHTGRNVGRGARAAGVKLPIRGKQTHQSSYITPSYNYIRFYVSGPGFNLHRVEYWFMDWFDGASRTLRGSDLSFMSEIFDWFRECEILESEYNKE